MNILFYDTETTGLPNRNRAFSYPTQPYVAQLACLFESDGEIMETTNVLVQPYDDNWAMSAQSLAIHGKSREMCEQEGITLPQMLDQFIDMCVDADVLVCHNVGFDRLIMQMQAAKIDKDMDCKSIFEGKPHVCTMLAALPIVKAPKKDKRVGYKWPTLQETYRHFYGCEFDGAHDALADITATRSVFFELCQIGAMDEAFEKVGLKAPRYG